MVLDHSGIIIYVLKTRKNSIHIIFYMIFYRNQQVTPFHPINSQQTIISTTGSPLFHLTIGPKIHKMLHHRQNIHNNQYKRQSTRHQWSTKYKIHGLKTKQQWYKLSASPSYKVLHKQ